jgi:hypothetical protein
VRWGNKRDDLKRLKFKNRITIPDVESYFYFEELRRIKKKRKKKKIKFFSRVIGLTLTPVFVWR